MAAENNSYPKESPYEHPSNIMFLSIDGDKNQWEDYDIYEYGGYNAQSEMITDKLCYACPVFIDAAGNEV
jgi:hypothetical protein